MKTIVSILAISTAAAGAAMAEDVHAALAQADGPQAHEPLIVEIQGQAIPYNVFFATALPGEIVTLQVRGRPPEHDISFDTPEAGESLIDAMQLSWKAPMAPGAYPLRIVDQLTGEKIEITVFVMRPASEIRDGVLNGYRIGEYPEQPLRGNPAYDKPLGFIEVTPANAKTKISPNFTIGEFLCKQESDAPAKYVVLRPALVRKLEQIISVLQKNGVKADTLYVMSGYRTPFYNAAIRNVKYSRHVYGDAADIYVDVDPQDGDMDDINGDGVVNKEDANYLYDLVDRFDRNQTEIAVQGGIGGYDRNAVHGPFVHVDVRGAPARWGR